MPIPDSAQTPVLVLTGFLGSGKTTLLNALLRSPAFADSAVIVNEFGEIGLDHHLIAGAVDNVVLLASGCLCCALVDSLEETLADLHRRRLTGEISAFARVLIETSGMADPGPILNTLLGNRLVTDHYRFVALACTLDAQQAPAQCARHGEARRQIAMADRLILTKADLASDDESGCARALGSELNPLASWYSAQPGRLPLEAFAVSAGPRSRSVPVLLSAAVHSADVRAHCFMLAQPVTWAGIAAWSRLLSNAFGDRLLRTKALLHVAGESGAVVIQGVGRVFHRPERLAAWPDADARGRIVCIVQNVDEGSLRRSLAALCLEDGIDAHLALEDLPDPASAPMQVPSLPLQGNDEQVYEPRVTS